FFQLSEEQKQLIWDGNEYFEGLNSFFAELEDKAYKIQNREMLSRYRGKTKCKACKGKRLREEATYIKVGNATLTDLVEMPIKNLLSLYKLLELAVYDDKIADPLLKEINNRLSFVTNLCVDHFSLSRRSNTLSGGESQRI